MAVGGSDAGKLRMENSNLKYAASGNDVYQIRTGTIIRYKDVAPSIAALPADNFALLRMVLAILFETDNQYGFERQPLKGFASVRG